MSWNETDNLMIRVILPPHLRTLAHVGSEVTLDVASPVSLRTVLDALEARYLRFFACEEDLSHEPPDAPLPEAVASGKEPLVVLGAIAGGSQTLANLRSLLS